jgi:single-stranded DNA-specific DHH superfamily exonuclease
VSDPQHRIATSDPLHPPPPDRGYGLKTAALEKLQQQGISLVITVDCGINAVREVRRASQLGLDFILTDHHEPGQELQKKSLPHYFLESNRNPAVEESYGGQAMLSLAEVEKRHIKKILSLSILRLFLIFSLPHLVLLFRHQNH